MAPLCDEPAFELPAPDDLHLTQEVAGEQPRQRRQPLRVELLEPLGGGRRYLENVDENNRSDRVRRYRPASSPCDDRARRGASCSG